MKDIIVLGYGMVGSAIAFDLSKNHKVTVIDKNEEAFNTYSTESTLSTIVGDALDCEFLKSVSANCDIIVSAVPGFLGYKVLENIINCKKNAVDISFFPEDPFRLDKLAKSAGITAVVDCGLAPGMDNIFLGYYNTLMKVTSFLCLVGGLPKERKKPFEYKAPFSPVDVIEEYCRPARLMQDGEIVVKDAMSDIEKVDFDQAGELEAFNTDGLRTLLESMAHIPNMKEKTLRYPGHISLIKSLKEAGFFSTSPVNVNGTQISPLEVTSKILTDDWKLLPDDEEFTVMRIVIEGEQEGDQQKITYELHDKYDHKSNITSMARTTGYTCTAVANLVVNGQLIMPGIVPPELIGSNAGHFHFILDYLSERGVFYNRLNC